MRLMSALLASAVVVGASSHVSGQAPVPLTVAVFDNGCFDIEREPDRALGGLRIPRQRVCATAAMPPRQGAVQESPVDPEAFRRAREERIGPAIAAGADFTVHSPDITVAGGTATCRTPQAAGMSDAEYSARLKALDAEWKARLDPIEQEKRAVSNQQRARTLSSDEVTKRYSALMAQESQLLNERQRAYTQLQDDLSNSRRAANSDIALYLQHVPRDRNATIVPLGAGWLPTAAFVADMNRVVGPRLAACGDRASIVTLHYYRDVFPFGRPDAREPAIVNYDFSLSRGVLTAKPAEVERQSWVARHDPSSNVRMRLAAMDALAESRERAATIARADYRRDHLDASKRQPGVVYKLDPYWTQFRLPDTMRRIFDGDFSPRGSLDYHSVFVSYAIQFSRDCAAQVKAFTIIPDSYRDVVQLPDDPVTGLPRSRTDIVAVSIKIDSRFAPFYKPYQRRIDDAMTPRFWEAIMRKDGPDFARMTVKQFQQLLRDQAAMGDKTIVAVPAHVDQKLFAAPNACTSATVAQLGENLQRAAEGRPSMQADGFRLSGAERESDPPVSGAPDRSPVRSRTTR